MKQIEQSLFQFIQDWPQTVVDLYRNTGKFPQVLSLVDTKRHVRILAQLGSSLPSLKYNIWSYKKGICPSLIGLFIDNFVVKKQLCDAIYLDNSKNHIIVDPFDTILCISLVGKDITTLKKQYVANLYNIRDHIHKIPKRYSIARTITQPMLCHGVRHAPSPIQPFGPYQQPNTHQPEHSSLIEQFVCSLWDLVQKHCPNIFQGCRFPSQRQFISRNSSIEVYYDMELFFGPTY